MNCMEYVNSTTKKLKPVALRKAEAQRRAGMRVISAHGSRFNTRCKRGLWDSEILEKRSEGFPHKNFISNVRILSAFEIKKKRNVQKIEQVEFLLKNDCAVHTDCAFLGHVARSVRPWQLPGSLAPAVASCGPSHAALVASECVCRSP